MKLFIEKEKTLNIDENTKLVLLNVDDFVASIKKSSSSVPASHIKVSLKYKVVDKDYEYLGESIFDSYNGIRNLIDYNSPYEVELVNWKLSDKEEKYLEFNFPKLDTQNQVRHFFLTDRQEVYSYEVSHYELDPIPRNVKLQICYFICCSDKIDLINVNLDSNDEEIGVPDTILKSYNAVSFKEKFKDVDSFCEEYKEYPGLSWEINLKYCGNDDIAICSFGKNAVGCRCPAGLNIDIMPLLHEVEDKLFELKCYK